MGLENTLYQPFKILDKKEHQTHRRRWVGGDLSSFKLFVTPSRLPAFQINRPNSNFSISSVKLFDAITDAEIVDITETIPAEELYIKRFAGFDQIIHLGQTNLDVPLPKGVFFIEITAGDKSWYSEAFTVRDLNEDDLSANSCNLIKLTWTNSCDIAGFYYSDPDADFTHKLLLDADLSPSEWLTQIEGTEDGEKVFFADFKRASKEWRFEIFAPEYIVDAVALIPLHDAAFIETYDGYRAQMQNVAYEPDSEVINGFRKIVVTFTVDFFISVGCCDNFEPFNRCFIGTQSVTAFVLQQSEDFDNFVYRNDLGDPVPMEEGQIFMIGFADGSFSKLQFSGGTMTGVVDLSFADQTVYTLNGENHFQRYDNNGTLEWRDRPVIDSISTDPLRVTGQSYALAGVELWLRSGGSGPGIFYKYTTAEDFEANGIPFDTQNGTYNEVKIKATGLGCTLSESDWLTLTGVAFMGIENDFVIS